MAGSGCSLGDGSTDDADGQRSGSTANAQDAALVSGSATREVRIGRVRILIRTEPSGVVCYVALRRPDIAPLRSTLKACVRHLRTDEIGYVIATRHTGQQMLAGVAGGRVSRIVVRLRPARVWEPRLKEGAFFGYIPSDSRAVAVTKVLDDGSRETFRVRTTR